MRSVLRRPDFRLLFAGVVSTMVGESALLIVLAIWVKQLTGSSSLAGVTVFAIAAPGLFAPLLGWVVDRFRRRPFLVAAIVATAAALTPLFTVHDRADVRLIYVVGVLYGVSMLVVGAALNGLVKELLPEQLLADANGALQTVRQGLRLVGPIGGAALFTTLGAGAVVGFDVVCLLAGALMIAAVKVREQPPEGAALNWLSEVVAGVRHLLVQPALRKGIIALSIAMTVMGFSETLIFQYVDLGLHRGPAFVTVIVCVQGVGGLTGGLLAARVVRRMGELGATALGLFTFGIGFMGLVYPSLTLAFAAAIVVGFGIPIAVVGFTTLLQRATPSAMVGRASAAADALLGTPSALSIAAGAVLATVFDYRALFVFMAVVMAAMGGYLFTGRALTPREPATPPAVMPDLAVAMLPTSAGER